MALRTKQLPWGHFPPCLRALASLLRAWPGLQVPPHPGAPVAAQLVRGRGTETGPVCWSGLVSCLQLHTADLFFCRDVLFFFLFTDWRLTLLGAGRA